MKKILVLFCLLCAAHGLAQIEHGGLTIPGDGAVQVMGKKEESGPPHQDLLLGWFDYEDWMFNSGSEAVWNPKPFGIGGITLTQSVEVNKPISSGGYLMFTEAVANSWLVATLTPALNGIAGIVVIRPQTSWTSDWFFDINSPDRFYTFLAGGGMGLSKTVFVNINMDFVNNPRRKTWAFGYRNTQAEYTVIDYAGVATTTAWAGSSNTYSSLVVGARHSYASQMGSVKAMLWYKPTITPAQLSKVWEWAATKYGTSRDP